MKKPPSKALLMQDTSGTLAIGDRLAVWDDGERGSLGVASDSRAVSASDVLMPGRAATQHRRAVKAAPTMPAFFLSRAPVTLPHLRQSS